MFPSWRPISQGWQVASEKAHAVRHGYFDRRILTVSNMSILLRACDKTDCEEVSPRHSEESPFSRLVYMLQPQLSIAFRQGYYSKIGMLWQPCAYAWRVLAKR